MTQVCKTLAHQGWSRDETTWRAVAELHWKRKQSVQKEICLHYMTFLYELTLTTRYTMRIHSFCLSHVTNLNLFWTLMENKLHSFSYVWRSRINTIFHLLFLVHLRFSHFFAHFCVFIRFLLLFILYIFLRSAMTQTCSVWRHRVKFASGKQSEENTCKCKTFLEKV